MNSTESIHVELQGPLAVLSLAQPARGNPIDGAFARDFRALAGSLLTAHAAASCGPCCCAARAPTSATAAT